MFSATNKVTVRKRLPVLAALCRGIMMMMMITEAAAHAEDRRTHKHGATLETVSLQLDAKTLETHRHTRLLNNASISPWTYNSFNHLLSPRFLHPQRSLPAAGLPELTGQEDRNLESRPIMHQVLLLRRIRPEGSADYHYRLESRLISVGCTCVKPVVRIQQ
uniref:Interleukin 17a/f1 n=1 Tax=Astatotilapia calliptera TaxID=8154 RepID=A0A3P8R9Y3_ASTCA